MFWKLVNRWASAELASYLQIAWCIVGIGGIVFVAYIFPDGRPILLGLSLTGLIIFWMVLTLAFGNLISRLKSAGSDSSGSD